MLDRLHVALQFSVSGVDFTEIWGIFASEQYHLALPTCWPVGRRIAAER